MTTSTPSVQPAAAGVARLYAERDIRALGQRYADHMLAMTAEGLHSKGAIAAELAHRDLRLASLESQRDELSRALDAAIAERDGAFAQVDGMREALAEAIEIMKQGEQLLPAGEARFHAALRPAERT